MKCFNCCNADNGISDQQRKDYEMSPKKSADSVSISSISSTVENLDTYVQSKNHSSILKRLESTQLGETSDTNNQRTVFYTILQNAVNGDKILLKKLDDCVTTTKDDENDPDNAIEVNLTPLMEGKNDSQVDIIKDFLDVTDTRARKILTHPVIQTFLEVKWMKIRKFFFLNFLTYLLFLVTYSMYLGNIFYRVSMKKKIAISELVVGSDRVIFPGQVEFFGQSEDDLEERKRGRNESAMFDACYASGPSFTCYVEAVLLSSCVILLVQELLQAYALGFRRYFKEFENILELQVIILALVGLFIQHHMDVLKWISAIAICLAYLELIFLMGRYPFLGGSISLMFYSIIRHLFRSLSNFLILIIGFSFGFFIIHHRKSTENFENPFKAFVKTLTMVLGEFDFNDLYDSHGNDTSSRTFTMLLLIGLAMMGSLVLVNLIVALIVSDIGELHKSAELQRLVNKAQHVVYVESVMNYLCCCWDTLKQHCRISKTVLICGHNLCHCQFNQMDPDIVSGLKKIVRKKTITKTLSTLLRKDGNNDGEPEMTALMKAALAFLQTRSSTAPIVIGNEEAANDGITDLIDLFLGLTQN